MWYEERTIKSKRVSSPKFSLCCLDGKVHLPFLHEPPKLLKYLLSTASGDKGKHFRQNIRAYNSMFGFTSMGGEVDHKINKEKGPYVFRINGQTYHLIGSLLPEVGNRPAFAQLYIYDTDNETNNRINAVSKDPKAPKLHEDIVQALTSMLDENNVLAKTFRMARDAFTSSPGSEVMIRLHRNRFRDARQYNLPTAPEVAGLIISDESDENFQRDVIIQHRTKGLQRITELHPSFMALTYPLLFPYGEDGYMLGILLRESATNQYKRQVLSMREYYCFRLQQRLNEGQTLLLSGRLLQQFIVDSYMAIEEERFRWIRCNQKKLRTDLYSGLMDAVYRGDTDSNVVGKSIILPSSHTGGPRYKVQNYQDAMAICRFVGYPDYFITFTCNPNWPEIDYMLRIIGQEKDPNRVDIVCRVFQIKLHELMDELKNKNIFGRPNAIIYTIEFQKRGLPHAHILMFIHPDDKNPNIESIDKIISAEIPNPTIDPQGYNAVTKSMMHGPCGAQRPNSPCMLAKGRCTKNFPKKFNDDTFLDDDGFPVYRRRDTGITVEKEGIILDNTFVVPYNRYLIVKFDAHMNIELCNMSRSIKYLFKYMHKGPDKSTVSIGPPENTNDNDEIKKYLDCRYISATEACWRIFQFVINYREPAVERLSFHLPGEHSIIFEENTSLENIVSQPNIARTKLTEWFEINKEHIDARKLTYSQVPLEWVWNAKDKQWTRRKRGKVIGRIYFAHPASGERYYLRMLLNMVKGSTSFESIRTVNGVLYPTFKAACYALGLLDDDKEWNECLQEAAGWATGRELRQLFVTILTQCEVANAFEVWKSNYQILSEDILNLQRKRQKYSKLELTPEQIQTYTLIEVEQLLQKMGKTLKDIQGMPLPNASISTNHDNRLLHEELDYDCTALQHDHENLHAALNPCQKKAYDAIVESVTNEYGKLFFINGPGGTGKTYLWNTIITRVRSEGKIVLPVATSGIAALLLPNGRTAHSRFHIPLDINEQSTCEIRHGTQLAELILNTSLIIWDEAPMAHKHCYEALDRTLRDILRTKHENNSEKPFGGLTVVLGGDFRQILPVIPKGRKIDIIDATINSSYLWKYFELFELKENMRLSNSYDHNQQTNQANEFHKWLLQIGEGSHYDQHEKELIKIPLDMTLTNNSDPIETIVHAVYPIICEFYNEPTYLQQRAILTPKNDIVHQINDFVMDLIPGEEITYFSSDTICKSTSSASQDELLYTTEFLNGLQFNGVPNHNLRLKKGVPAMLLRNINQTQGLCNGTRLLITHLAKWSVVAQILTGTHAGTKVTIPRIVMSPNDAKWPFKLKRRQLPLSLCYAMTINKSQGQTLQRVGLFLPKQVFTHGQLYVAASRVTSKEGLLILNVDNEMEDNKFVKNIVYKEIFHNTIL